MLGKTFIHGGSAFHLIEGSPAVEGHSTTIQSLRTWYGSADTTSCTSINQPLPNGTARTSAGQITGVTIFLNQFDCLLPEIE
jgi:hypothetical protein